MDVAISTLRAELSTWIERAHNGDEVVITDRGVPVARLVPVAGGALLDRLIQDGVLARPGSPARPAARSAKRVRADGPVSDLVDELRR